MITLQDVSRKLRHDVRKAHYMTSVRAVTRTPPLSAGSLPFLVLSMVQRRDVLSYLVAIKSFASHANPARIVIVCDASIGADDRTLLRQQIPHVELRDAAEFLTPGIPVGGCWERLHALCQYARQHYVVQLDADTVTIHPPAEVIAAITAKSGFVLGEEPEQTLLSLPQTTALSQKKHPGNQHIQCVLEAAISSASLPVNALYVRGCAGFTGFPQSSTMVASLFHFADAIHTSLGQRWADWGTEQAASNYLVANAIGTKVLPFPAYATPDFMDDRSVLIHFIGSLRFTSDRYREVTVHALRRLHAESADPLRSSWTA